DWLPVLRNDNALLDNFRAQRQRRNNDRLTPCTFPKLKFNERQTRNQTAAVVEMRGDSVDVGTYPVTCNDQHEIASLERFRYGINKNSLIQAGKAFLSNFKKRIWPT